MKRIICLFIMIVLIPINICATEERMMKFDEVSVHDPSIIKDSDGKYYVFGSHITTAVSDDMMNWKTITNGYARHNNAHFGDLSKNLKESFLWAGEDDSDCKGGFAVWAPDVYFNKDYIWENGDKGAYMMYYSASSTYKRSCIGLAVSKQIDGVYNYVDTVIYSGFTRGHGFDLNSDNDKIYTNTNIDELIQDGLLEGYKDDWGIEDYNNIRYPNAIDPCVYEDKDGRLYLTYGSWSGGIFSLPIEKETGLPVYPMKDSLTADGRMTDRYFGTHIAGGKGWSGEGPFIYYDMETGYYYLQVSYEGLGSTGGYHIRMFRSKNPTGPFEDIAGNSAIYGDNHASHGVKMIGNYAFSSTKRAYTAGGHSSMLYEDGERYTFFHTRFKGTEYFEVRVHQMFMNEDGWPVMSPFRYTGCKLHEYGYRKSDVVGFYEYIDHGNAIGEGNRVTMSKTMELCEDGRINGVVGGFWEQNGKYVTINYGDEVLKGVFFQCVDEKGNDVMTFSVTGGENRTLWGVKKNFVKSSYLPKSDREITLDDMTVYNDEEKTAAKTENGEICLDGSYGLVVKDFDFSDNMTIGFNVNINELKTYTPIVAAANDFDKSWFSLTNFGNGKEGVIWSRAGENNYWMEGKGKGVFTKGKKQHVLLVFDDNYYGNGKEMVNCRVYIDGFCTMVGYADSDSIGEGSRLYIGINPWDTPLDAVIGDIKVFNHAFSHTEAYNYYKTYKN